MFRFIFLLATLTVVACSLNAQSEFKSFKTKFNKIYGHPKEESYRYQVFTNKLKKINEHNKREENGLESYRLGVNKFADLTFAEFSHLYLGINGTIGRKQAPLIHTADSVSDLAATVDWREKGIVNEIKDQAQCGSCWAFSATASIEGAWAQAKKSLVSLSEQNLMDCSYKQGNDGCDGGLMDSSFDYVIRNKGLDTEDSYPYKAESSVKCKYSKANVGASISNYADIKSENENALKNAAAKQVISVAIDVVEDFQLYESGIFNPRNCPGTAYDLNHGVAVVGYGSNYWIVRNSWGSSWGEDGYVRFAMGKNLCGIATSASYPIV